MPPFPLPRSKSNIRRRSRSVEAEESRGRRRARSIKGTFEERVPKKRWVKWTTYAERLQIFTDVVESLESEALRNGEHMCIKSDVLGEHIQIGKRIGSESVYGEAFKAHLFGKNYLVSVKKVALTRADRGSFFTVKNLSSGNSAWAEIAANMLCTILMLAKVCNNLPFTHKYTLCDRCHFVNKNIRKKNQPCILIVNELADGDLKQYLKFKSRWTPALIDNCVFQIAAGLYALEKYFRGMTHNDLHYGNILVHEIQAGGYWEYKIDGKKYYVPNLGYVFVLWDFGMVHIPGKIKGRPTPGETDLGRICYIMRAPLRHVVRGKHSILQKVVDMEGYVTLKETLATMFPQYGKKPTTGKMVDRFNMDLSIESVRDSHSDLRQFFTTPAAFRSVSAPLYRRRRSSLYH